MRIMVKPGMRDGYVRGALTRTGRRYPLTSARLLEAVTLDADPDTGWDTDPFYCCDACAYGEGWITAPDGYCYASWDDVDDALIPGLGTAPSSYPLTRAA